MCLYAFFFCSKEIDDYIGQAKDKSYDTLVHFGRRGLNVAATAAVMAATKVMQTLSLFCPNPEARRRGDLFFLYSILNVKIKLQVKVELY